MSTSTAVTLPTITLRTAGSSLPPSGDIVPPERYLTPSECLLTSPYFDPCPPPDVSRNGLPRYAISASWRGVWRPDKLPEGLPPVPPASSTVSAEITYDLLPSRHKTLPSSRRQYMPLTLQCPTVIWENARHVPFLQLVSTSTTLYRPKLTQVTDFSPSLAFLLLRSSSCEPFWHYDLTTNATVRQMLSSRHAYCLPGLIYR